MRPLLHLGRGSPSAMDKDAKAPSWTLTKNEKLSPRNWWDSSSLWHLEARMNPLQNDSGSTFLGKFARRGWLETEKCWTSSNRT